MPKSLQTAFLLTAISIVVAFIDCFFQTIGITIQDVPGGSLISLSIGTLIIAVFFFLIWKQQRWAYWLYVVFSIIGLPFIIPMFLKELQNDKIGAASTLIQFSLQLAAVVFLLKKPSRMWVKKTKIQSPEL